MMQKKWFKILAITLVSLLTIVIFLIGTRPGVYLSYYITKLLIPGHLKIENIEGNRLSKLTLHNLYYKDKERSINIKSIIVKWRPRWLLLGKLSIRDIKIKNMFITEHQDNETQLTWAILQNIRIENGKLDNLSYIDLEGYSHNIDSIILKSKKTWRKLVLTDFVVQGKRFKISSTGEISHFAHDPIRLQAKLEISRFDKTIHGKFLLQGNWKKMIFNGNLEKPFNTILKGQLDLKKIVPNITLKANWNLLEWPLTGHAKYQLTQGNLKLLGPISHYHINSNTQFTMQSYPSMQLSASGQGNLNSIELNKLSIKTKNGQINGKAKFYRDPLKWQADLEGKNVNPGNFLTGLNGKVNFQVKGEGGENFPGNIHQIELENLSGSLHSIPIQAHGKLQFDHQHWLIEDFQLHAKENHIYINGGYDKTWKLNWKIHLPNLTQLHSKMKGQINSEGEVSGKGSQTSLNSKTTIEDFYYKKHNLDTLSLNSSGTFQNHDLLLQWQTLQHSGEAHLNGKYDLQKWNASLKKLNLKAEDESWKLQKPIQLNVQTSKINIPYFCVNGAKHKICFGYNQTDPKNWDAQLNLKHIPTVALPLPIADLIIDSHLNVDANIHVHNGIPKLKLTSKLSGGEVKYVLDDDHHAESLSEIIFNTEINETGLIATLKGNLGENKQILSELSLPDYKADTLPEPSQIIKGTAKCHFDDIAPLTRLWPNITEAKGMADLQLSLNGTIAEPRIHGNLELSHAQAYLSNQGITLKGLHLALEGKGENTVNYHGEVSSGDGKININGSANISENKIISTTKLNGKNFLIANTDEYQIIINPDLTISNNGKMIELKGDLFVPQAKISPRDFSETIEMPIEVVYVEADSEDHSFPFRVKSDIQLTLGEKVDVDILGIRGRLKGHLNIHDDPQQTTIANGELEVIDGKYEAYGKNLKITRGALLFTGGRIENPGLNVRAEREVQVQEEIPLLPALSDRKLFSDALPISTFGQQSNKFTVGIAITGTLEKPFIKLFSSPIELPESEILSYLLLNRSTAQLQNLEDNVGNHNTLLNALPALGLSSQTASKITHELQHALTLDQFEITGTSSGIGNSLSDTSLIIGKALSPRLYVNYSYGILNAKNVLRIRYLLSSRWTLQTEAITDGNENAKSIDFIYSIAK